MNMVGQPKCEDSRNIISEMNSISQDIDYINAELSTLEDRLAIIMPPELDIKASDGVDDVGAPYVPKSKMTDRLENFGVQLQSIRRRLIHLHGKIEL